MGFNSWHHTPRVVLGAGKAAASGPTFVRCMTDRTSGWVVQITIPPAGIADPASPGTRFGSAVVGAPTFKYFNVAMAAPSKAVEATKKHWGEAENLEVSTVRALSSAEISALDLQPGEVKPA